MASPSVTPQSGQQLWLRKLHLVLSNSSSQFDLSSLQVAFRVVSRTIQTLKYAEITVYNPAPNTAQTLFNQKEFVQLSLSAGYQNGPFARIFQGKISYLQMGKWNATDSYLIITAADGDDAYNWGVVNNALPGNPTAQQQLDAILQGLAKYGVTAGTIPPLPNAPLDRGKVLYGMARDPLTDLARSVNCDWHIADGKLNFISRATAAPAGKITILTPQSGLVGTPEQTLDGLRARALLNPNIVTGSFVEIHSSQIAQTVYSTQNGQLAAQPNIGSVPYIPGLSANGVYQAYSVVHHGDTRGQEWYTDLIAVATQTNTPVTSPTFIQAIVDGN